MPRPDVSEERRPQIVEAATQVFIRKGYRKTTMPDIAREAGLSVGGVYWYFKSKDEVVLALLEEIFQSDLESMKILLDSDSSATERLKFFVAASIRNYDEIAWINSVGLEFFGQAGHDPLVRGFIQAYISHYRQALVRLIEQGIERGEFRTVNPVDTANAIIGLEEGLSMIASADPEGVNWKNAFRTSTELLLIGLSAKDNPK